MLLLGMILWSLSFLQQLPWTEAALHYPSPLVSRLEHLLVDTDGSFRSGFKDAINPCTNYVSGAQTLGRQTSAQWLRVAFHDFVTAHVDQGTGGIDASIGFETLRAEDSGSAFNDSFTWFAPFVDAQTSMADLIALSVVTSLGNCGGLRVPYRAGRIDATGEGPFGVPEPETDLEETLEEFANAGFNAEDAIGLTACGHSLGRTHHGGFPNVVPESAVTPDNTGGGINFDSTRDVFDDNIVHEYLGGYGQRGGPMVTSDNLTVRSDLRLYESDSNSTMKKLAQSKDYFFSTCNSLFERMINTIPKEVQLSEVVRPITVKPVNFTFDITNDDSLTLSGAIRYLSTDGTAPSTIEVSLGSDANENISSIVAVASSETGHSIWGTSTFYPVHFVLDLQQISSVHASLSRLHVSAPGPQSFELQPELFYVPSLSSTRQVVAAIVRRPELGVADFKAVVSVPSPQAGTLAPKVAKHETVLQKYQDVGPYSLYKGDVDSGLVIGKQASVDVIATLTVDGSTLKDEYNKFL